MIVLTTSAFSPQAALNARPGPTGPSRSSGAICAISSPPIWAKNWLIYCNTLSLLMLFPPFPDLSGTHAVEAELVGRTGDDLDLRLDGAVLAQRAVVAA